MITAIEYAIDRIVVEEGFEAFPYNDKTGTRVSCHPEGNLTWLYGLNLETEGSRELGILILRWKLGKLHAELLRYSWYVMINDVRASVLLEIAYNTGVQGLLHFPVMIAALRRGDWESAQAECHVKNPELKDRYARLGKLLLTGVL
jgi:lysozyme